METDIADLNDAKLKINFIDKTISGDITVKDAKVTQGGSIEVFEAVNDAIVRHNYLQETFFLILLCLRAGNVPPQRIVIPVRELAKRVRGQVYWRLVAAVQYLQI